MSWRGGTATWTRRLQFWRARGRALALDPGERLTERVRRQDLSATPAPPANDAAWEEAYRRVENYLRAHHLSSRVRVNELTSEVLREARRLAEQRTREDPVELAMHVLHLRLGTWLARAFHGGDWADERFRARGRLALVMTNLAGKFPHYFLSEEPLPADLTAGLKECSLQAGPELNYRTMPAAPLEFPFGDDEKPAWASFGRRPFLAASVAWLMITGLFLTGWIVTR